MLPMWHASEDGEHPYDHSQQRGANSRSVSSNSMATLRNEPQKGFLGSFRNEQRNFDPDKVLPVVHVHRPLKPSSNPPQAGITDYLPFLKIFKLIAKPFRKSPHSQDVDMRAVLGRKRKPLPCDSNVPVELSLFLMK